MVSRDKGAVGVSSRSMVYLVITVRKDVGAVVPMRRLAGCGMGLGIVWVPRLAESHNIFGISQRVVIQDEDVRVLWIVDSRVVANLVGRVAHR